MLRNWVAKFNKTLSKRSSSRRMELAVPIKLMFEPERNTGSLVLPFDTLSIKGETVDLSMTGVAFAVPSIRLREFYLVGEGRTLNAEVMLPNGTVRMRLMGLRYEQTGEHLSVSRYLVGSKILDIKASDRAKYEEFLDGSKESAGVLKLEIEKG